MIIEATKGQCESVLEFIELNLFDVIRNDTDIDNIEWLQNMMDFRKELKRAIAEEEKQ